ncbi:unnamed protein product [Effrenium voratum]|nr:unnamed protein product [Effrenium voratum]
MRTARAEPHGRTRPPFAEGRRKLVLGFVSPPLEGAVARRLFRPSHRVLGFWPTQYHVCPRCGIGVDLFLKPGSKDIDSAKFRFGSIALNVCMCYMSRDVEMAFSKLGARLLSAEPGNDMAPEACGALLRDSPPELHALIRRSSGLSNLCKDILEMLKKAAFAGASSSQRGAGSELPVEPEELVALGEQALDLEEMEDSMLKWPNRDDRAAHQRLVETGIGSAQALLTALQDRSSGKCRLNQLLEEAGCKGLKAEAVASLSEQLEVRARQRIEVMVEGPQPVLLTAPHNIYLRRDGQPPHIMEEYTTLIAQRLARQLRGACLSWSRAEQKRSELHWSLARVRCGEEGDFSSFLACNRDPNYLHTEEVTQNPWFRQMARIADQWRHTKDGGLRPTLHIDVHGCRDPPATPSHLTVGLAAMRHEVAMGRSPLSQARVEAFAQALQAELNSVLSNLDLRPRSQLVRVLLPAGKSGDLERLSGAWPQEERRLTQSQQAVAFAGFTHSCQLELSKALRRALSRDDAATGRLGRAVTKAWAMCCQSACLPMLRSPGCTGSDNVPEACDLAREALPTTAAKRVRKAPSPGPPGADGKEQLFAGVDLGGTTISVGVVTAQGDLKGVLTEPLGEDHTPAVIVCRIRSFVEAVLRSIDCALQDLRALGVCAPGLLDARRGVVSAAANLRGWREVPLVKLLAEEMQWEQSRVTLENDANTALLAEAWTGAAAGKKHIVLLTIGTGIGGAIMCDGQLLRGSKGQAGEIGHIIMVPDGLCFGQSGVQGIFEDYASARAVALRAKQSIPPSSSLSKLEAVECVDVFKHAAAGDSYAAGLVKETAKYLAVGCINCCRFVDPEIILFSGGMSEAGESLLQEIQRQFEKYHWNLEPVRVRLELASTGRHAGLIGAARASMI